MMPNRVKISINGRFLLESQPTGTHRSALGFTKALIAQKETFDVAIHTNLNELSPGVRQALEGARLVHTPLLGGKWINHLWEQFLFPFSNPDAIHFHPLNTGPFVFSKKNQVIAIHDIYVLTSKGLYGRPFILWNSLACGLAARRSRNIVCFTEHVKRDISGTLKIASEHITVIPQGPGINLDTLPLPVADLPEKYFLCVGGLQPHKNLKTVILSFARSQLAERGYVLLVIGRRQANFAEVNLPKDILDAPWLKFTSYVEDGQLISYYQHAVGFVYISLLEGFGLPLVESFNLGCPVITSDTSCLPEVAGDAALLVDPRNEIAVADAMVRLAVEPELRRTLSQKGRERAALYTWKKAGEKLAQVIWRVAESIKKC